jgi:predicted RNase H-like HicB family nuclease
MNNLQREFYVVIKRDEDGYYIGEVPQLKACYGQGETIDELMANMKEVIELCLEEQEAEIQSEFINCDRSVFISIY